MVERGSGTATEELERYVQNMVTKHRQGHLR